MKLLIGTTNQGKLKEMQYVLRTLPFEIVSLADLGLENLDVEETENTIEGNALLKAKTYAEKTGLITLADDSGLFIDIFDGYPGVKTARIGKDTDERIDIVLEKLQGKTGEERNASFKCAMAIYDPNTKNSFISLGETKGELLTERQEGNNGFGYDPIFQVKEFGKTYNAMTMQEKDAASHRGKALSQAKYYLKNQHGGKHIIVPCAVIVDKESKKVLLAKRNDPHKPMFHEKWEFSGGAMELGETLEDNIIREIEEECGYTVNVEKRLNEVGVFFFEHPEGLYRYQVYLLPHLCTIASGDGNFNDEEVLETKWFSLDEIEEIDLIGENKIMFNRMKREIKQYLLN